MSALGVFLIAVGISDLVGGQLRLLNRWNRWIPVVVGVIVVGGTGALAGFSGGGELALLTISALAVATWQLTAARAFAADGRYWVPLMVLVGTCAALLGLAGLAGEASQAAPLQRWMEWSTLTGLQGITPTSLLAITGLLLIQLSTANVVVRLVLSHVGAMRPTGPQPSDRLRGGRLLGPMERVVILGLGLAGQLTAASLVIAAKGLIRWPELQKSSTALTMPHPAFGEKEEDVSIDSVTEYFLVGSFVSWVIALSGIALASFAS